jgi:hypothetical protein
MANVTAYIENLRKVGDVSRIDHPTTLISRMNAPMTRWSGFWSNASPAFRRATTLP